MNWGNKLFFSFLIFGAGMTYLVYRAVHTSFELVEKDYYKTELRYQDVIDASGRADKLNTRVTLKQEDKKIYLQLPAEMNNKMVEGDIWFYCAYDARRDKKIALKTGPDGLQILSANSIAEGRFTVKISWYSQGKAYYWEDKLTVL